MEDLKNITNYYSNPFLGSINEVYEFLRQRGNGSAIRFQNNLIVFTNNNFMQINMDSIDQKNFINRVSVEDTTENILSYMGNYGVLGDMKNYNVQVLKQGDYYDVLLSNNRISTFVISNKIDSNYFDYQLLFKTRGNYDAIYYSNRNFRNQFIHSGDQGRLLHHVTYNNPDNNQSFVLSVVGYNIKPLRSFLNQQPVILLVNHETQTLSLVPCPLDQATVGNNTFANLVVGKIINGVVRYYILPTPTMVNAVTTGQISNDVKRVIDRSIDIAEEAWKNQYNVVPEAIDNGVVDNSNIDNSNVDQVNVIPYLPVLRFIEDGLINNLFLGEETQYFSFGTQLKFMESFEPHEEPIVRLSSFGICKGPSVLALCETANLGISMNEFHERINNSTPIVHLSTKWIEQGIKASTVLINGIFIIHIGVTDYNIPDPTHPSIINYMNNINIAGVSTIAGPNSIVLMAFGENLHWYRGVRYPGIVESIPEFGSRVNIDLQNIEKLDTKWDNVYYTNTMNVFWKGSMISINDFVDDIRNNYVDFDKLSESNNEITDVLTQLQVIMSPEALESICKRMIQGLSGIIENEVKQSREKIKSIFVSTGSYDNKEIKVLAGNIKTAKRRFCKTIQPLINKLGQLTSVQGSSKRSFNLKQMERKNKIYDNVKQAHNMTLEEKFDLLEEHCSLGVILTKVDRENAMQALKAVSENNYLNFASKRLQLASLDDRTICFDPLTYGSILEISGTDNNYQQHTLAGAKDSVAIPLGQSGSDRSVSCLPFPLCDEYVEIDDPSKLYPVELCNDPKYAMFRILLRGTISGATSSRSLNIQPSNYNLGHFIVDSILSTMESLASRFSSVPTEDNFDDTSCQIMRGLFGQLLTILGSGQRPLSMAWQMVMSNPNIVVPKGEELWIYNRMANMFKYTCWNNDKIILNTKKLIVDLINKYVVQEKVQPMITNNVSASSSSYSKNKNIYKSTISNEEKQFIIDCVYFYEYLLKCSSYYDNSAIELAKNINIPLSNERQIMMLSDFISKFSSGEISENSVPNFARRTMLLYVTNSNTNTKKGSNKYINKKLNGVNTNDKSCLLSFMQTIKSEVDAASSVWKNMKPSFNKSNSNNNIKDNSNSNNKDNSNNTSNNSITTSISASNDTIVNTIKQGNNYHNALALYELCRNGTVVNNIVRYQFPLDDIYGLLNFVGIVEENYNSTLQNIISTLLANWNNKEKGLSEALNNL